MPKAKRKAKAAQNGYDPLSGPEVAAAIAREEVEAPSELKPLKIVGCILMGGRYNDEGKLIGEEPMTGERNERGELIPKPFTLWEPDFGKLEEIIDNAMKAARMEELNA